MGFKTKYIGTTESANIPYVNTCPINTCYCSNKLPPKDVLKNKHFEKSFSAQ